MNIKMDAKIGFYIIIGNHKIKSLNIVLFDVIFMYMLWCMFVVDMFKSIVDKMSTFCMKLSVIGFRTIKYIDYFQVFCLHV